MVEIMEQKIFDLSDELKELKATKSYAEQELKEINAQIKGLEESLIEEMANAEISSFKRNGSNFSMVIQNYPSAVPEMKSELYEELKSRGFEHLFTINHQTLTSTLKELIEQNENVAPEWFNGLVKDFEKTSIRVTK